MSALILIPQIVTITSATNVATTSKKEYLTRDRLGLDTKFTADTVIVIDRGNNTSWDSIAFVQSTIQITATVKIEYSNSSTFASGVTTIGPVTVPINTVNSERAKMHVHELASASTLRYIRVTFASAGAFTLGRIVVGSKIVLDGIAGGAERTFEDMSEEYSSGVYQAYDEQPVLLGWKFQIVTQSETYFRSTIQAFMQRVGNKQCFLFLPLYHDNTTWQSDWTYGRVTVKANAQNIAHGWWQSNLTVRGIYP